MLNILLINILIITLNINNLNSPKDRCQMDQKDTTIYSLYFKYQEHLQIKGNRMKKGITDFQKM